jgi:hypothetical protein
MELSPMNSKVKIADYHPRCFAPGLWTLSLETSGLTLRCEDNQKNYNGRALIGKIVDGFLFLRLGRCTNDFKQHPSFKPQIRLLDTVGAVNVRGKYLNDIEYRHHKYHLLQSSIDLPVEGPVKTESDLKKGEWIELTGTLNFHLAEKYSAITKANYRNSPMLLLLNCE